MATNPIPVRVPLDEPFHIEPMRLIRLPMTPEELADEAVGEAAWRWEQRSGGQELPDYLAALERARVLREAE